MPPTSSQAKEEVKQTPPTAPSGDDVRAVLQSFLLDAGVQAALPGAIQAFLTGLSQDLETPVLIQSVFASSDALNKHPASNQVLSLLYDNAPKLNFFLGFLRANKHLLFMAQMYAPQLIASLPRLLSQLGASASPAGANGFPPGFPFANAAGANGGNPFDLSQLLGMMSGLGQNGSGGSCPMGAGAMPAASPFGAPGASGFDMSQLSGLLSGLTPFLQGLDAPSAAVPTPQPAAAHAPAASSSKPAATSDPSAGVHPGVSCDGCGQSPIRGLRFKCSKCVNYDLCTTCEPSHDPSHPLIKIRPTTNAASDAVPEHPLAALLRGAAGGCGTRRCHDTSLGANAGLSRADSHSNWRAASDMADTQLPNRPRAEFVADVNMPDRLVVPLSQTLVKTWKVCLCSAS